MTILENQVAEIEEEVTGLDQDVNFLFDEQVIQDERLLILEQDSDAFDDEIESKCASNKTLRVCLWIVY